MFRNNKIEIEVSDEVYGRFKALEFYTGTPLEDIIAEYLEGVQLSLTCRSVKTIERPVESFEEILKRCENAGN